ncbi:CBO0543 family protein [Paenibacillus sp. MMO-177]|uniref:CBO0543 family protein n=1 Tax=Paenibacillus sp. MMO-177 TaxID=3081289 RepID=UPI003017DF8C
MNIRSTQYIGASFPVQAMAMDMERNLLLLVWFVCITAVYFLVPRAKAHEFVLCFLVCQAVGWIVEVLLVHFDLVAYPLREFPKASDLNITFKVVWTPVASGLYYIHRPRANKLTTCFYFAVWISLLTLIDGMLAAKTELVEYVHFHWSLMAIVLSIIFLSVHGVASSFFRNPKVFRKEASEQ